MMRLAVLAAAWMSTTIAEAAVAPHPDVLAVRWQEAQLPPYQRSHALYNPLLQHELHYSSALHSGEQPVYEREADRIPRKEIFTVLAHAGFLPRGGRKLAPPTRHPHRPHRPSPPPFPQLPHNLQYL